MEIKLINYGLKNMPTRKHYNDAGADVYAEDNYKIEPHMTLSIPLLFGVEIPDGYVGYIMPRSSMAAKGLVVHPAPIDSGYRGMLHAIITNTNNYTYYIEETDRIAQLVIIPVVLPTYCFKHDSQEREMGAFGSTGK